VFAVGHFFRKITGNLYCCHSITPCFGLKCCCKIGYNIRLCGGDARINNSHLVDIRYRPASLIQVPSHRHVNTGNHSIYGASEPILSKTAVFICRIIPFVAPPLPLNNIKHWVVMSDGAGLQPCHVHGKMNYIPNCLKT
jgi:hypothetical protein